MAKKWPFIVVYALIFLGILFGSFYDLQIDQALYSPRNGFGVFMAAISENTSYMTLGFLGGLLLGLELAKDKILWRKILFIAVGLAVTAFGIRYGGKAIISRNAYNIESAWYIGYPIAIVLVGGAYAGGYFFAKLTDDPHWQRDIIALIAFILLAFYTTDLIKKFNARPRFRWLVGETDLTYAGSLSYFHSWWDNALTLRSDVLAVDSVGEEFRSFPSGHATSAFVALATLGYLPRFHSAWLSKQNTFFFIGLLWALLSAFSRLLIGAHFLSDVSFGALITTTWFLVADFVLYHKPFAKKQAQAA